MATSRVYTDPILRPRRLQAGIISRIRLRDFMCHSNLEIELGDWVNFITGQNGSGKSAILTALCIAFGCRAKSTQRATTMKDFIKTGCSSASIWVEIKNQGEDAFKPETYGDMIILERKILQSTSTTILKSYEGKIVASKREELVELVEHFNIDVENPCVIMSQDKSREFLHSGNNKDKFKFFYKATLLQRLGDLLNNVENQLNNATVYVVEMEKSLSPLQRELDELETKIKSMEEVEEISKEVQLLKKKLAWSWVYDVDRQLKEKAILIEKLKDRVPICQAKIDHQKHKMDMLNDQIIEKRAQIGHIMERTSEVRRMKDDLQHSIHLAMKEKLELDGNCKRKTSHIEKLVEQVKLLERQIHEMQEQHIKDTQAEEFEMKQRLKEIQGEISELKLKLQSLKDDEESLSVTVTKLKDEIKNIASQIEDHAKKHHGICSQIRGLQENQKNKVSAFGGERVIALLQVIERHRHKFRKPPIGPIGSHVTLDNGNMWGIAIENAVGGLLNAFIVTDHKDSLQLRACAKQANYNHLRIIIYDFSRPRLNIPSHMLPQTKHPTAISVLHSDNAVVVNVLIDLQGNAERQVLVKDYNDGKAVAFDQRVPNLKEVYTSDGFKMFSRGPAQTILPPNRKLRAVRLCGSYENQIKELERDALYNEQEAKEGRAMKRNREEELHSLQGNLGSAKRKCDQVERYLRSKELKLQDLMKSYAADACPASTCTADELHHEISKVQEDIQEQGVMLQKVQLRLKESEDKASSLRASFEKLCESAKVDIDALEKAEDELLKIEKDRNEAEAKKKHFEEVMTAKVIVELEAAKAHCSEFEHNRKESCKKASIICPESEIEALGGCRDMNPEELSAQLNRLNQRLQRESQRFQESIEDLRMLYERKHRRIRRKEQIFKTLQDKLKTCRRALEMRQSKFQRNATLAKRELTWKFNAHLGKKGISGKVIVSYEQETLSVEVTMPQDASNKSVCDTRGLSGGERSFSTLCFALALHEMTEAPFRAMDEFDIFMDAVSRKISLDTLVDFALAQGSQWIFITPHDISMVKQDQRIKKQQMAAPRA
ncbi:structural maintenance of chromosomes protein 6B-like isoform X1 [Coffea arabica]|uniref:Structural maintenance of chromosomes protein 6B-like isoform X1 n=1 Tax=Coffea arabica TaxID=13443 RepID=A0A6P6VMN5_COFAR|nr:structural maintenance of chromosomes protein 6B-like isoform X1 [Coffea arabica]